MERARDSPQIATADGGVIGSSGITYDNQGRATGQGALPGMSSWQGFMYSVTGDPVTVRMVPPNLFLNVDPNLLNSAGGNPSGTGTTFPGKDDPWTLRLVPVTDDGADKAAYRNIDYKLYQLDGTTPPLETWYVTEHQTNVNVAPPNGMSGGIYKNEFKDLIGCNDCRGAQSYQNFTISKTSGAYDPISSYGSPTCGTTNIVVHTPVSGDYGCLGLWVSSFGNRVNNLLRWPGVPAPPPTN